MTLENIQLRIIAVFTVIYWGYWLFKAIYEAYQEHWWVLRDVFHYNYREFWKKYYSAHFEWWI